jgi:hypothetical protein
MVKSSISAGASATLLTNDQVLLANEDIDIYRPAINHVITVISSLPTGSFATAVAVGAVSMSRDRALIVEANGSLSLQSQIYSRLTNTLSASVVGLLEPVVGMTLTTLRTGEVLLLGGFNAGIGNAPTLAAAALYEPSDDVFVNIDPSSIPCKMICSDDPFDPCGLSDCASSRVHHQATMLPGRHVLISGEYVYQPDLARGAPAAPKYWVAV